ncbi:hypothetical protein Kpol_1055p58 [Vanderwaltozyma polyspora DSM 70294]|uniref:Ornithine decarboxylase n=1 Tax=Vanderwaltozyma polyspora (strain ATCC 22028 / DSM 70294 / BCRC 21397 / CBS 2163 / NBRC 10782 / NRRL Y-8283 / UCD 57-17) TaxID=436907 RepID=A7TGD1_VANPO|nr:uncharacterized protein Kpol_1055p58 [Vanderwaltozyma polyspora DSM 70294]EDO18701.1 hypothetical protein Kpol_1055p58 [Vanderwaltozyma polyspora DSM 70294]
MASVKLDHSLGSSITLVDFDNGSAKDMVVDSDSIVNNSNTKSYKLPYEPAHEFIFNSLKKRIESINEDTCAPGEENSFFVCDLGELEKLYKNWKLELPNVQPFYAVKCNPNEKILQTLDQLGINFDCASKSEIDKVLSMNVDPERIIYANPCKASSFIRYAQTKNVLKSTFDNVEELHKIKKFHPNSELFIRIATDDSTAQCRLSTKYGCELSDVENLLQAVKDLDLNLVGVAFHVGSGASDFTSLYQAVKDSRYVFDKCIEMGLPELKILDIGGGFQFESFHESSKVVRVALEEYFPGDKVKFMAEPGRYFVSTALTLASNVIAKRTISNNEAMLYINDGVYGNMNCILFDHQEPIPRILYHNNEFHYYDFESSTNMLKKNDVSKYPQKVSIWGPTCDGLDCITKEYYLKHDLEVGDWFYFPNLGAYTSTAATPFNGFQQHSDTLYINSLKDAL